MIPSRGVAIRVYLDSVGPVVAGVDRSYKLVLDGSSCSFEYSWDGGAPTRATGSCGIVSLSAVQSMRGHNASVDLLVGEVGGFLRQMVEAQDALRIEMRTIGNWECVFDGFISEIHWSETSSAQGFSWRMSISAEGIQKLFGQMWLNYTAALHAGTSDFITPAGISLQKELSVASMTPSLLVAKLLRYGVGNLMDLKVRGGSLGMASPVGANGTGGQDGFWQLGAVVDSDLWESAWGLKFVSPASSLLSMSGSLWQIVDGLSEPALHEMFVTYLPSSFSGARQIPTLVFRPHPYPGGSPTTIQMGANSVRMDDDRVGWDRIVGSALVLGKGDRPSAFSVSSGKSDSHRVNHFFWAFSSANDGSKADFQGKSILGYWVDENSVRRYGYAGHRFTTGLIGDGRDVWWHEIMPKALRRVAYQTCPLPFLWRQQRSYILLPDARIGVPLFDAADGAAGYITQVSHRVTSSPTGFKASTTLSVERVVDGLTRLEDYPAAVRAFCSFLKHASFLPDKGVEKSMGEPSAATAGASSNGAASSLPPDVRVSPTGAPLTRVSQGLGANQKDAGAHKGVDFPMKSGTRLVAPCNGWFTRQAKQTKGGIVAFMKGVDGSEHAFCHCSELASLTPGQKIDAGVTLIGKSGTSGVVTGPHLHWQVKIAGVPVDPRTWLNGGQQA